MTQSQAIVKSPPPLDVSSNVSAIVSKSTFDIQEHQVSAPSHSGDDVSRSDQYSTGSIPFEKRSENVLETGIHICFHTCSTTLLLFVCLY